MKTSHTSVKHRTEALSVCPNFKGIEKAALEPLARLCTQRIYDNGEFLFQQDEVAEGFHILVKGTVNIQRVAPDGRQQILHIFEDPGAPCGEVAVFEGSTFPAAAFAATDVTTIYIPRDAFIRAARENPEILLKMLATLSRRLRRFVNLIDDLALKDVSARLARHILDLSEKSGTNQANLTSTKSTLASRLGTIAETLSRTLRKLQDKKIIEVDGRQITILDEDALEDIAEGMKF